jgi:hypothetical protein
MTLDAVAALATESRMILFLATKYYLSRYGGQATNENDNPNG